jgi:hypothetical protein
VTDARDEPPPEHVLEKKSSASVGEAMPPQAKSLSPRSCCSIFSEEKFSSIVVSAAVWRRRGSAAAVRSVGSAVVWSMIVVGEYIGEMVSSGI